MFGYIRPHKPELRIREYEVYRGVYCSLCRRIGHRYGFAARMSLSYDCTFLALLSLSVNDACPSFHKGRCGVNPTKRCKYIKDDKGLDYPAEISVLLSYFSARDNLKDRGFKKKLVASMALPLLSFPVRKIKKDNIALYELVEQFIKEQECVEASKTAGIDASAQPTAHLMERIFTKLSDDAVQRQVLARMGYYIGRWVYLVDAADDLEDDRKMGNYNPFIETEISSEHIGEILTLTLNRAIASFDLLTIYHYHDILQNILVLGLPAIQDGICKDKGE